MRSASIIVICGVALASAVPARGWHHETTHREINTAAFNTFIASHGSDEKYARSRLNLAATYTGPSVTSPGMVFITETDVSYSMANWIRHGGFFADQPETWAALRHFYDPLEMAGVSYLTDTVPDGLVNPQVDARTLALTAEGDAWSDGADPAQYNWEWARVYYGLAMTETNDRDRNLAKSFRALGQVMHLVADMTQPAHVRNDSHPSTEPVEDAIRTQEVIDSAAGPADSRVVIRDLSVAEMFDSLAQYTNQYFVSSDTICDEATGVMPQNGEACYPTPQLSHASLLSYNSANRTYYGSFNGRSVPMVQMTPLYYILEQHRPSQLGTTQKWHVPPSFAPHQAAVLIPIAVRANAEIIHRFLPTLNAMLTVSATSGTTADILGELYHDIDRDPEWKALGMPIHYNGPGSLMRKGGAKVADVTFVDGRMEDLSVSLSPGDVLYLEIRAGGRIFTSDEETFDPGTTPNGPLITNGDFESGYPSSDPYVEVNDNPIPGWQIASSQWAAPGDKVYWRGPGSNWQQVEGSYHVYLGYLGLQTTFQAEAGKTYTVQFYMTGMPNNSRVSLDVTFGNFQAGLQRKSFEMSTLGATVDDLGWASQTCSFTMPAGSGRQVVTLSFTGGVGGPAIDAVTVE